MSTLKLNNIEAATGTTINIASGDKLTGATGSIAAPGSVIQVQSSQVSAWSPMNSDTLATTGLAVSITPKFSSSKVLILVSINGLYTVDSATYGIYQLYKGSSFLNHISSAQGQNQTVVSESLAHQFLDSPSTTSATTYSVYYRSSANSSSIGFNNYALGGNNTTNSTITAMEIAQ